LTDLNFIRVLDFNLFLVGPGQTNKDIAK